MKDNQRIWLPPLLQKDKYKSIVDLDFFSPVEMIVHSKRYISYRFFQLFSTFFSRAQSSYVIASRNIWFQVVKRKYAFKWQKRKGAGSKQKTCSSLPVTARTKLSSFRERELQEKKKKKRKISPQRELW